MRRLRVQNVDGRHSLTGTRLEIKPAASAASWRREGLKESHHAWKGQTRAKGTRGATACELSDRTGETIPPFQHPLHIGSVTFSSVTQSCPTLCDPIDCSTPGLLSITNSQSPPRRMSIESVTPSSHLNLRRPLLLLPSIFPSIRVFSNESAFRITDTASSRSSRNLLTMPKRREQHQASTHG